jgi:hypothetical protein
MEIAEVEGGLAENVSPANSRHKDPKSSFALRRSSINGKSNDAHHAHGAQFTTPPIQIGIHGAWPFPDVDLGLATFNCRQNLPIARLTPILVEAATAATARNVFCMLLQPTPALWLDVDAVMNVKHCDYSIRCATQAKGEFPRNSASRSRGLWQRQLKITQFMLSGARKSPSQSHNVRLGPAIRPYTIVDRTQIRKKARRPTTQ